MRADNRYVEYTFTLSDGKVLHYKIDFDRSHSDVVTKSEYPAWCELGFHQCANCPLSTVEYTHCPTAIDAQDILFEFKEILSFNEATVIVKTPEREYAKQCDAQTGLRALIGFVMATSACPILSPTLRGLAHFHLPFATLDEIVFRSAAAYLISQYYVFKDGGAPDLEMNGLKQAFQEIQTVNYDFMQRIQAASEADSSLDVLSTLFSVSSLISFSLDSQMDRLRPLFSPGNMHWT